MDERWMNMIDFVDEAWRITLFVLLGIVHIPALLIVAATGKLMDRILDK